MVPVTSVESRVVALPAPAWFRPDERFAVYRPGAWCTDLDREVQQRPVATVLLCADWRSDRGLQLDCVIDDADCKGSTSQHSSRSYLYTPDGSCSVPSFCNMRYRTNKRAWILAGARTGAIYDRRAFDSADMTRRPFRIFFTEHAARTAFPVRARRVNTTTNLMIVHIMTRTGCLPAEFGFTHTAK